MMASQTDPAPVIVDRLTKRYGATTAVRDLSFTLAAGTITGFLGPNGAGKSTTLRLMLGLASPTSGTALVFGRPYADLPSPAATVGAILESDDFHPTRTGRAHLRMLALAAHLGWDRVEEVLAQVDLTKAASRPVRTYSLGMRQRLGLASALLGRPSLLVLDEPVNGLDPAGVHWVRTALTDFAADGGTVLVSSHILAEVAKTVDRVLIIHSGRLLADAAINEFSDSASLEATYLKLTAEVPS
jgi:ABC-2 type transport system ATP-binding protein